jgi:hydroxyethylthiazole kinase
MLINLFTTIQAIKDIRPLVLNLTNQVTIDFIANGLLALGASPVMSCALEELEEMINLAASVVINIGTLNENQVKVFKSAVSIASKFDKKIIIDPVGAGATCYRTNIILDLLESNKIDVIKGNASEIMAIAGREVITKGVDSNNTTEEAIDAAKFLAAKYQTCIVISGIKDFIINKDSIECCEFGDSIMSKVTGMGCLLSSIIAAFCAVEKNNFTASVKAVTFFGIVGELVANYNNFPASFKINFIDKIYNIQQDEINSKLKKVI